MKQGCSLCISAGLRCYTTLRTGASLRGQMVLGRYLNVFQSGQVTEYIVQHVDL